MNTFKKIQIRLLRKSKYLYGDILASIGLNRSFYNLARGNRIILYHGVCNKNPFRFNTLFITKRKFEEHLRYYKTYFNVVTLSDFYEKKFSKSRFNICLTFDDGFANNYNYVLPLLNDYKLPATFFITAINSTSYNFLWNDFLSIASKFGPPKLSFNGNEYVKNYHNKYINESKTQLAKIVRIDDFETKIQLIEALSKHVPYWQKHNEDYWQQMTENQIKSLSLSKYVTIGSHGLYHNDLSKISNSDAIKELTFSKNYLESIVDKEVSSIAFPYGAYNDKMLNDAQEIGYKQLLTTEYYKLNDANNPLLKERFTINPFISIANQMRANIIGKYE